MLSSITFLDISELHAKDSCSLSRDRSTDIILPYTTDPADKKQCEMSSILYDQSHGEVQKMTWVAISIFNDYPL